MRICVCIMYIRFVCLCTCACACARVRKFSDNFRNFQNIQTTFWIVRQFGKITLNCYLFQKRSKSLEKCKIALENGFKLCYCQNRSEKSKNCLNCLTIRPETRNCATFWKSLKIPCKTFWSVIVLFQTQTNSRERQKESEENNHEGNNKNWKDLWF